jgi:hydroxymethylpyrimidine/phosphomethylpyrimidine kinase
MGLHFPPVSVTIGASVSSGSSGIQADLKTFTALNVYGASVVTAAVAQAFAGVQSVHALPDQVVRAQLDAVTSSLPVRSIKIGLMPTTGTVRVISRWLREHPGMPVVVDPIIATRQGIPVTQPEVIHAICEDLLPHATVATPNRFEAATLAGLEECLDLADMEKAATTLFRRHGCPILVTGGGFDGHSLDVLCAMDGISHYDAPTCQRPGKVHGAGCAHSAAIAASLAKNDSLREAILEAKSYVSGAIAAAPELPGGDAVLWHGITVREQVIADVAAHMLGQTRK